MNLPKTIQAGQGRFQVTLTVHETGGHGLECLLTGGELPHVGGVAVACPRPKTSGTGLTCDMWVISLPGHKDAELAQPLAKRLCVASGQAVSLTAGLHIDHAGQADIQALCDSCRQAVERYLAAGEEDRDD